MQKKFIDFEDWEMIIIETNIQTISDVFKEAVKRKYKLPEFALRFLSSDVFNSFFSDQTLYTQSPKYVLNKFEDEMREKGFSIQKSLGMNPSDLSIAKEIGETFAWWKQTDSEFKTDMVKEINFEWVCRFASVIFMQDYSNAINEIKESIALKSKNFEYE